jgi:hypothetical protein
MKRVILDESLRRTAAPFWSRRDPSPFAAHTPANDALSEAMPPAS